MCASACAAVHCGNQLDDSNRLLMVSKDAADEASMHPFGYGVD
jgi:hypothetical protein